MLLCTLGFPTKLKTDNGREFQNKLLQNVLKVLEIEYATSIPYIPHNNNVERAHIMLGLILRTQVQRDQQNWDQVLPNAMIAMNSMVSEATGFSLFYLLYGRDPNLPVNALFRPPPVQAGGTLHQHAEDLERCLNAAFEEGQ